MWKKASIKVNQLVWKPRAALPAPGKPESDGRDLRYDAHLAGRGLLAPLDRARGFLVDEAPRVQ